MTDINFSVAAGTPPQLGNNAPLWSFNGVRMLAGPSGSVILHNLRYDCRTMVQPDVAEALRLCSPFRTLESHTRNITEAFPALQEHAEHTHQTLQTLADAGIFESSEACWNRLTTPGSTAAVDAPTKIFILTCDRPSALNRLLSGLREFPLPRAVEGIWIIDDSRQSECMKENAAIVDHQAEGAKVPVVHVDLAAREDLICHLKGALPQHAQSIDWLLDRSYWNAIPTYGQARNIALLLSVGRRAIVLDDDIVPQAIAPPLSGTGLRFGTANDREAMFYSSKAVLSQHAMALADSPLALMLQSLGQPLGALLAQHLPGHDALMGVDGGLLSHFDAVSPVKLCQCGTWGDAGTGSSGNWIFHLPQQSLNKLLTQTGEVSAIVGNGANWLGYRGPTITSYGVMAAVTGIDHRSLLPPYLPAGRSEDVLFGILLQRLYPDSAVWNEGWAIRHEPVEERIGQGELSPLTVQPGIALLTDWLGREPRDQWGLAPTQRLAGIAGQVRRLADMNSEALESLVRQELVSRRGVLLDRCMTHLGSITGESELPGATQWRAFLEQSRDQLVSEILTPEVKPLEERASTSNLMQVATLRSHGHQFALALSAWPEICEAAEPYLG